MNNKPKNKIIGKISLLTFGNSNSNGTIPSSTVIKNINNNDNKVQVISEPQAPIFHKRSRSSYKYKNISSNNSNNMNLDNIITNIPNPNSNSKIINNNNNIYITNNNNITNNENQNPNQIYYQYQTTSSFTNINKSLKPFRSLSPKNNKNKFKYLLPSKNSNKKTLVLDLDETLVHSCGVPFNCPSDFIIQIEQDNDIHDIHVLVRPHVEEFLERMRKRYELVIFTASISKYANPLLNIIDKMGFVPFRLFREHCTLINTTFVKDLSLLGRELKDIIILDNNPDSYALNKYNGIPILSWFDDANDKELLKLLPLLKFLSKVKDVRPIIKKIVNNERKKIDYLKVYKLLKMNNKIKIGEYKKLNAKKLNPMLLKSVKVNLEETQLNNYFNTINSSLMNQIIRIRNVKELKNQYHGVANELNKGKEMLINYNSIDKINQEKKLINNNRNKKNIIKKLKFNCMLGTLINKEKKPTDAIKRQEIKINNFDNILTTPNKNELQNNLTINNGFNNYKKKCIKSKD